MDKKIFIKNRPFDVNDAIEMQTWTEDALKKTMASIYTPGIVSGLAISVNSNLKLNIAVGTAFDSNYDFINVNATQTLTLDAANTSPRIDKVIIKYLSAITDNVDTGNIYGLGTTLVYSQNRKDGYVIQFVKGTPGASPVAPATPAGAILLAEVTVPANATSLIAGNIVDRRAYISINNNIVAPEVVFSGSAPGNTNVLWIDTTNIIPKIYKNSAWTTLNSNDATTLDGLDSTAFSLTGHNHDSAYYTKTQVYTKTESDTAYTKKSNNLSDIANVSTARTNLGLGTAATENTSVFAPAIHDHEGIYTKGDYILSMSPSAPTANTKTIWWDTTNNLIKRYNGSIWVVLTVLDAATVGGKSPGVINGVATLGVDGILASSQRPTVNDGNLTTKGIVQLNSATNSVDETTAATPKAVKAAMDAATAAQTTANNKTSFSGSYTDLTNKPTIPNNANQLNVADVNNHFVGTNVETVLDELFTFANDGKTAVAGAVTAKGVAASPADTFSSLATKIGQISTGKKWASGTGVTSSSTGAFLTLAGNSTSLWHLTVSGLTFRPSSVLIFTAPNGTKVDRSFYTYRPDDTQYPNMVCCGTSDSSSTQIYTFHNIRADAGTANVTSTGFTLPTGSYCNSMTAYWIAIE